MMIQEVKQKLITVLETFCPDNVYLQGTLNPEEQYPNKFITLFINTSDLDAFYDNNSNRADLYISVMFYSNNPTEVATVPMEIISALKTAGFIAEDVGNDVISDVQTHTGWAIDFVYPFYSLN